MRKTTASSIWVIFLNIFVGTIALGIISQTIEFIKGTDSFSSIFTMGILGSLMAFIMYGLIFLIPLLLFLFLTTSIFIKNSSDILEVKKLFIAEFILLGILFTYFAIRHSFPSWYFFIAIFGISQFRRYRLIRKSIN